jgi:zinc finger FYVE domain-containing protein 26
MHFDEGLSARHKGGESTKLVTKGLRGKSASEKLSEEGLVKFSTRVSIQVIGYTQTQHWNDSALMINSIFGISN